MWDLTAEDITAVQPRKLHGHPATVSSLAVSLDGHWLVTGDSGQTARVWELSSDPVTTKFVLPGGSSDVVWHVAIGPRGRWLVTVGGDDNAPNLGTFDVTARLWDLHRDNPAAAPILLRGHERAVMSAAISPDGRWVATGSFDGTARLWDLRSENPAASPLILPGHAKWGSVVFSPDGRWLVTGHVLRDLGAPDIVAGSRELRGRRGRSVLGGSAFFSADSRWLVKGSQIWDLAAADLENSSLTLRGHTATIHTVTISPDGRWVATGSDDKTVRLWPLNVDALLERALHLTGRELTSDERQQYFVDPEGEHSAQDTQ